MPCSHHFALSAFMNVPRFPPPLILHYSLWFTSIIIDYRGFGHMTTHNNTIIHTHWPCNNLRLNYLQRWHWMTWAGRLWATILTMRVYGFITWGTPQHNTVPPLPTPHHIFPVDVFVLLHLLSSYVSFLFYAVLSNSLNHATPLHSILLFYILLYRADCTVQDS